MDDTSLFFSRIDWLLHFAPAVEGVKTITIGGYKFTAVDGLPYNTVDRPILQHATPAEHCAFVTDLVEQWLALVALHPAVTPETEAGA